MSDQDRKARLIDLSPSRKEIELEIGSDEVEKEYAKVLGDYAARVKLPGFRKGHAPRDMVRNLLDHDILHDVYDEIIPRALDAELKARGLVPVAYRAKAQVVQLNTFTLEEVDELMRYHRRSGPRP